MSTINWVYVSEVNLYTEMFHVYFSSLVKKIYVWFKYNLDTGTICNPKFNPTKGSNPWPSFHVTEIDHTATSVKSLWCIKNKATDGAPLSDTMSKVESIVHFLQLVYMLDQSCLLAQIILSYKKCSGKGCEISHFLRTSVLTSFSCSNSRVVFC